jgi:hypothetical protein
MIPNNFKLGSLIVEIGGIFGGPGCDFLEEDEIDRRFFIGLKGSRRFP